ncbi:hypothetical protein J1N35_041313 [Gossypium stocksii]|uniref:Uncharacterized protein n=1 Tax=Gossypium stocksii TaxID=47602 RepID=A0A9D3UFD9_9ROSI|nr:hypothetical protein J1N35_041313 [Gossypium stocksii]
MSSSSPSAEEALPMSTYIFWSTDVLTFFTPCRRQYQPRWPVRYRHMHHHNDDTAIDTYAAVYASVDVRDNADGPEIWGTLLLHADNDTNTDRIIVLSEWFIDANISHNNEGYTMEA